MRIGHRKRCVVVIRLRVPDRAVSILKVGLISIPKCGTNCRIVF